MGGIDLLVQPQQQIDGFAGQEAPLAHTPRSEPTALVVAGQTG